MKNSSGGSEKLYEAVAGRVERLIERQVLRPGDKVPSVRKLSREQGISLSTAFQAYYLLEKKGFIEAKPRSGYYVRTAPRRFAPPLSSATTWKMPLNVRVDSIVSELMESSRNRQVVDFSVAGPSTRLLPVAKINKSLQAAMRSLKGKGWQYPFPPGNQNLLRQIARHSLSWGGSLSAEDLVVTNGCMEALNLCLRAVAKAGDIIAIESPTYYGILQCIEGLGMKVLEVPACSETGVDLDSLEKLLDNNAVTACLFTLNFNNPLGSCMPAGNKERLVRLLGEREVPLIEDDVLGDIYFGKSRPVAAKSFDKKGLVLYCSSFSKTIAPGFRIGWTAPGRYKEKVERLKFMTSIGTSDILQEALAHFLENGRYENHLKALRLAYHIQVRKYTDAICRSFPKGTKISHPLGGQVLWIELPAQADARELQKKALEKGISILPGTIFTASGKYRNCIRIGYGKIWSEETEKAIHLLGSLFV